MTEFAGHQFRGVGIDHVAGLHHLALFHEELHDVDGALGHTVGELLDGDRFRQNHLAGDFLTRLLMLGAFEFLLTAAHGRQRTAAIAIIARKSGRQCQLATAAVVIALGTSRARRRHFGTRGGALGGGS